MVLDKSQEEKKVIQMPKTTTPVSISASISPAAGPSAEMEKNIVRIARIVGKRPLQGTRLLVRMAISLSLGESIMRHPVTPAALQPKPIIMVSACFPQELHFAKQRSRLKAALGR